MAEQSIRYQQQEEIKNLVNEFTKKPDLAWEAEDNEKIKIAEDFTNEYCQKKGSCWIIIPLKYTVNKKNQNMVKFI